MAATWDLALCGIDGPDRQVSLVHLVEDRERITSETLERLVEEAGSPATLGNLTMSARQPSPHREVLIQLGPGNATIVTVEAEDNTWAIGRHTEIMERLNSARKWYSLGKPAKFLNWPSQKKKPKPGPLSLIKSLGALAVSLVGGFALLALIEVYVASIVFPPYLLVRHIADHQKFSAVGAALELLWSAIVIVGTVWLIILVLRASRSKVIIAAHEPFFSSIRLAIIGAVTGIILAIAAVLALFKS
jgi:hypothetical protein